MMTTNGGWYPQSNIFQHPPQATNLIFMSISDNKKNQEIQNSEHSKDSPTDDTSDDESLCDEEEVGQARRLRNMNINEWLTDEKVQDILDRVQAASKTNKNRNSEITRTVGDAINDAQMGMYQAFIAGALATYTGVARKDSLEHSQTISEKDAIQAAAKAKTYLKEAIRRVKTLAEDDFGKLRLLFFNPSFWSQLCRFSFKPTPNCFQSTNC